MSWFPKPFLGPSVQTVGGGGAAGGLSNDFISVLQKLLNSGGMGAGGRPNAPGSTGDIYSVLSDIFKGANGNAGGAIQQLLSKQQERDVNGLRARFGAQGGTAFGTPGAIAEGNYRAGAAPQIASAITNMQMQAIGPLLQAMMGISGKAIPQAQIVQNPGFLDQALKIAGTGASIASGFRNPFGGPSGSAGAPGNELGNLLAGGNGHDTVGY